MGENSFEDVQQELDRLRKVNEELSQKLEELHGEVFKRDDALRDMHNAGTLINSSLDLEKILVWLIELSIKTTGAEVGCIVLKEPDEDLPTISWGLDESILRSIRIREDDKDIIEYVLETGKTVLCRVPEEDTHIDFGAVMAHINTMLVCPLNAKGKVVGVISVINKSSGPEERFDEQDSKKLVALSDFAAVSIDNAKLHKEALESQRYKHELSLAQQIQTNLLPRQALDLKGIHLAVKYKAAKGIGGDYYDFFQTNEDHLDIIIADVSNKGVPAALVMTATRAVLRAEANTKFSPQEVVYESNQVIYKDINRYTDMFVTLFYGKLNLKTLEFVYTNAGHCWPMVIKKDSDEVSFLKEGGIFLGLFDDPDYEEQKIDLEEGDLLVFYTDGITEMFNQQDELYGEERLIQVIQKHKTRNIEEILELTYNDVLEFGKGMEQADDMALLLLKVEREDGA